LAALLFFWIATLAAAAHPAPGYRPAESRTRSHAKGKTPRKTRKPALEISKINDPNNMEPISLSSKGEAVIRSAILLDRLKLSPGEIGQSYNDNLAKAVTAFQVANGLTATGNVDPPTWQNLNQSQAAAVDQSELKQNASPPNGPQPDLDQNRDVPSLKAITTYVIALEDVNGKFTKIPRMKGPNAGENLMLREAKLPELNYQSALELLAEKFHSSPRLLVELNPGKAFDKAGTQLNVPNVLVPDPPQATSIVVDGPNKSVSALDGNGRLLAFYPATVGSQHDPLPAGEWKIKEIIHYPHFKYNPDLFWDAENKHPRATLPPGPNNPVGVVWIGLSKEHYGIHGTPEPSRIGASQSHGCIRLTNWDALQLSKIVRVGTVAVLKGSPGVELTRVLRN